MNAETIYFNLENIIEIKEKLKNAEEVDSINRLNEELKAVVDRMPFTYSLGDILKYHKYVKNSNRLRGYSDIKDDKD